jgi:hypothetical protein
MIENLEKRNAQLERQLFFEKGNLLVFKQNCINHEKRLTNLANKLESKKNLYHFFFIPLQNIHY